MNGMGLAKAEGVMAADRDGYQVSAELDELSCDLMGEALDLLAEGEDAAT